MHNQPYDEPSLEHVDCESDVATIEPAEEVDTCAPESTGPRCEKCEAPIASDTVTVCRHCGWYASLGAFVELDPNWEADAEAADPDAEAKPKSHLRVWLDLLPRWSWLIIVSVVAVVVESVAVRLATPAGSWLRTTWSVSQLMGGVLLAVGCHVFNFLVLATEDVDFGVLDLFMKPFKLWTRAIQKLPTRQWVANGAVSGLTAAVMSLVVIGGIPYERLWDWGFQEPVKQNLMGAVMDRAKQLESRHGNLEDSVRDFAGSGGAEPGTEPTKPAPPQPRHRTDCVILGYKLDRDGRLDTLLLGTAHRGQLVYAGRVSLDLPANESAELLKKLAAAKTPQAFISIEAEATWVQPKFTCRVTFAEQQRSGMLRDIEWDRLLGQMQTP